MTAGEFSRGTQQCRGEIYTIGNRAIVRKSKWLWGQATGSWVVTNHPFGPKTFLSWKAAMDYANTRPVPRS
jgi:hypothetical protein